MEIVQKTGVGNKLLHWVFKFLLLTFFFWDISYLSTRLVCNLWVHMIFLPQPLKQLVWPASMCYHTQHALYLMKVICWVQRTLLWPYETVFRLWVGVVETFLSARRMSEFIWQRINEWRSQGLPEAVCPGKASQKLNWTYKSETVTSGREQRKMEYRDEGHWHQEPGLYVQKWKQNKTRSTVWVDGKVLMS